MKSADRLIASLSRRRRRIRDEGGPWIVDDTPDVDEILTPEIIVDDYYISKMSDRKRDSSWRERRRLKKPPSTNLHRVNPSDDRRRRLRGGISENTHIIMASKI